MTLLGQVVNRVPEKLRIVLELSEALITVRAQESTYALTARLAARATGVVMVYGERLPRGASLDPAYATPAPWSARSASYSSAVIP